MTTTFVVSARYARLLRAAIAIAVADAGRDRARREKGRPGHIRESLVDLEAEGEVVITVAPLPTEPAEDPFPEVSDEALVTKYGDMMVEVSG